MKRKMTRRQALALAVKALGSKAAVSENRWPSSPALRARAHDKLREIEGNEPKFLPLEEWPASATVGEYREALKSAKRRRRQWEDARAEARMECGYYQFSVGTTSFAYLVCGQGDSWEEALAKATGRA